MNTHNIDAVKRVVKKRAYRGATTENLISYLESLKAGKWEDRTWKIEELIRDVRRHGVFGKFSKEVGSREFYEFVGQFNCETHLVNEYSWPYVCTFRNKYTREIYGFEIESLNLNRESGERRTIRKYVICEKRTK